MNFDKLNEAMRQSDELLNSTIHQKNIILCV